MSSSVLNNSNDFFERIHNGFIVHQQIYEQSGILEDITLRSLSLTLSEIDLPVDLDTPLQNITAFLSMRRVHYPDALPTLQDHLESFFYIVLYFTHNNCQHTDGHNSVSKILGNIIEKYLQGKSKVVTRGCNGISALIADESRVDFKVIGDAPLTDFLNDALVGIWAWYAHHQVIKGHEGLAMDIGEAYGSDTVRHLYLYGHEKMRASFDASVKGLRGLAEGTSYESRWISGILRSSLKSTHVAT